MKTISLAVLAFCITLLACRKQTEDRYPSFILAGQKSGEGIRYIDVSPDDTISGFQDHEEFYLDADKDGEADFLLYSGHTSAVGFGDGGSWITPLGENQIAMFSPGGTEIDTISFNETIDQDMKWSSAKGVLYYYSYDQMSSSFTEEGVWNWAQNTFIGIKLVKDDIIRYGWIREEISVVGSQVLMEYAITSAY